MKPIEFETSSRAEHVLPGRAELLTGIEGTSSRPVRRIVLRNAPVTDRLQIAAVVDRLICGHDTTIREVLRGSSPNKPFVTSRRRRSGPRSLHMFVVTPIRLRGALCLAIMTIFASSVVMATAAFAVDDSPSPNASAAVRVDMAIAALLAKVEQQISDGSIIAPYDDNAQKTWQVVEMQAAPASADARMALSLFAEHWQSRALNEEKAGRLTTGTYLKVFAEFATDLLERTREPSAASASQGTLRPLAEGRTAPGTSIETPRIARGDTRISGALASLPHAPGQEIVPTARLGTANPEQHLDEPVVPNASTVNRMHDPNSTRATAVAARPPTLALAVTASPLATVAPAASAQLTADVYAKRGDDMLAIRDISAARKFYEYAANAGSARAATALARTLDPAFITQLGAVGLRPDPTLAATWYGKAASLGDRDAQARLYTLSVDAAK